MPGDTFTPPHHEQSTVFDDGNVLEFRKARDDLRPQSEIQAERDVRSAYAQQAHERAERPLTPVEYAALQLTALHAARQERMVNEDKPFLKEAA